MIFRVTPKRWAATVRTGSPTLSFWKMSLTSFSPGFSRVKPESSAIIRSILPRGEDELINFFVISAFGSEKTS